MTGSSFPREQGDERTLIAVSLLAELERRGAHVARAGDRLRITVPPGSVPPALRRRIETHKPELLRLLSERERSQSQEPRADSMLGAVRIRTRFGEVWVAFEARVASELEAEGRTSNRSVPVLLQEEVGALRDKSSTLIRAVLEVKRILGGRILC